MYNSEKEIKSTTTVDICNNQEDYDPTLVLIADNIDSDKAKVLETPPSALTTFYPFSFLI
jgi:hypothetical protein